MRAQVTTFLVLGIIVLIIIGFASFVSNFLLQNRSNENADLAFKEFEQTVSLNSYVLSCIRASSQHGLWLLGTQGGYISKAQGGTQSTPSLLLDVERTNLAGITDIYDMAVWKDENNNAVIPALCSVTGANRRGVSTEAPGCVLPLSYGSTGENIQDSLSSFINNSLDACVKLDDFVTKSGSSINKGKPYTEVVLNPQNYLVKVNYPFVISVKGKTPETKLINFTYNENVRLQSVYVIARLALVGSINTPDFSIVQNYADIPYYEEGIVLAVQEDYLSDRTACAPESSLGYCDDDLVYLQDQKSSIATKSFEFMFGMQD